MKIPFKNSFLSWMMRKRIHQIELFLKYPFDVQDELLLNLIDRAKDTEFGKEHGFTSINCYEDFNKNVAVKTYEESYPYIKKLRDGGENILWPGKIKWFAKSAGTTNAKSKYIPITEQALEECHYKAGKDMLSIYCNNNPETTFFDGMGLMLGGSQY
ncbi:MAG TPA: GH3 auxin-responsive promoter family protein, partial [Flavobacteriales bacterium]|nr:GH3 auxin-responsive promoter family protein [Flavobacteriales bacterium]